MSPTYPVAFALAASRTQAPVKEALLAFAFGWAENMVQAGLKSVPLGQSAGQRILARGPRDSRRCRPCPAPDGQRTPSLLPHAGHPVGAT